MLDAVPRESEKRSWIFVCVGIVIVYGTIPLARAMREIVNAQIGRDIFLYTAVILLLVVISLAIKNLRRRNIPGRAYLWLISVLAVFLFYIYQLRKIPEEAVHVVEYGILSLLIYRALVHRLRDFSIYIVTTLLVCIVGVIDEYIQWIVPSRTFDLRDIRTNFIAGSLVQIAVLAGLRPAIIDRRVGHHNLGLACYIGAVTVFLLALGFQNTPQRVAWYASQHPALEFLLDSQSMMVEYGYRYDDPDTGAFRSRFSPEQLRQLDLARGEEVAKILDRYIGFESYRSFLQRHTVIRDAYVHEVGVHLFRRNFHVERARENLEDAAKHYTISFQENGILKNYFPTAITLSDHRWNETTEREVSAGAERSKIWESTVSASVFTSISVWQALGLSVFTIALLAFAGWWLRRGRAV